MMRRLFFFYSFLYFLFVISGCFCSSLNHHLCSPIEAFALLHFKQSFQISDSDHRRCVDYTNLDHERYLDIPKTMSWNESKDCCTWDGVTCDMLTGHVIGLDLSCSQLSGAIHPNNSLFQLYHLHTLNLAYNDFNYYSIPNDIGHLTNLRHLNLSESSLTGKIPTEISYLSNLVSLDLSYNDGCELDQRTFETMLHNFSNLEVLSLRWVSISSPIPVNISSSCLSYVNLQYTDLRGVLTESFFLLPNLETLMLGGNDLLKGVLPNSIGTLSSLNRLYLYGCQFSGSIPDSVGNLTQIRGLDLSNNHFTDHIPDSIGNLTQIRGLYLSQNHFTGHIPDSIGNLTQIRWLSLSFNHFTDHIPSTISKLKQLSYLVLSSNSFSGEIPDVFSNLRELRYLGLSSNSFIGSFPSTILSLTRLETLDLSSNSLSGPLPSNGSMLQNLTNLDLSFNSLNGTIPSWVFSLPLLTELWLNHNRLRGLADEQIETNPTLEHLHLSHNQFSGSFPQSLVNLTNLVTLSISSNNVTIHEGKNITFPRLESLFLSSCNLKDFPHFLRNVKTLNVLDISNNKIHGQIPNWLSGMRWDSLRFLNLSYNSLTGHLPQFHYYNLGYLDLKFNFLQGPLPSSICNMSGLSLLDLSHNSFSDSVPRCLGSMVDLSVLDLRRNNFTGSLPPFCAHGTSLSTIVVNGNQFEGTVPMSLLNCGYLEILDVGNNAINDTFPAWLGMLQELQVLILKSNRFHGPISTRKKFYFPRLRIFDLSCNEFSGSLPAEIFQNFKAMIKLDDGDKREIKYMEQPNEFSMYENSVSLVIKGQDIELEKINTIMTTIDLSSNHFEGVIPKSLKDLGSLRLLNLSHNNLKGNIPMELGQLTVLEALDLSWNRLIGKIPTELTKIKFLAVLNLSQNLLVGPIPQGLQFNTFENDSYGGNLDLCGPPLSKQCGTSDSLESDENEESYFFSGFTWESVVIGYSFGLVVGTVVWNFMFKYRKPKWIVEFFDGIMPHKRRRPKKSRLRRRT